jgi:hypothetical protein
VVNAALVAARPWWAFGAIIVGSKPSMRRVMFSSKFLGYLH